jgi:hypothetical protein
MQREETRCGAEASSNVEYKSLILLVVVVAKLRHSLIYIDLLSSLELVVVVPFKTIEGKQKQLYPNPKEAKE